MPVIFGPCTWFAPERRFNSETAGSGDVVETLRPLLALLIFCGLYISCRMLL